MIYGADTWTLNKQAQNKLAAAHTKNGKNYAQHHIHGIYTNICFSERTEVIDKINNVRNMKLSWVGHITRLTDDKENSQAE